MAQTTEIQLVSIIEKLKVTLGDQAVQIAALQAALDANQEQADSLKQEVADLRSILSSTESAPVLHAVDAEGTEVLPESSDD